MGLLARTSTSSAQTKISFEPALFIGLDPGASGGYAVLDETGKLYQARKWPETLKETCEALRAWKLQSDNLVAVLEEVGPSRVQRPEKVCPRCKRGGEQGVASAFAFGRSFGSLEGLLTALDIPFLRASPGKWQKPFMLPTRVAAGSATAKKNAHKARAQELWPKARFTHATADATLLAEWGRRSRLGK